MIINEQISDLRKTFSNAYKTVNKIIEDTISSGTAEEIEEVLKLEKNIAHLYYNIESEYEAHSKYAENDRINKNISLLVLRIGNEVDTANNKKNDILNILKSTNDIIDITRRLIKEHDMIIKDNGDGTIE